MKARVNVLVLGILVTGLCFNAFGQDFYGTSPNSIIPASTDQFKSVSETTMPALTAEPEESSSIEAEETAARMLDKEIQEAAKDIYLTSTILTPEQGGWDAETVEAVFSAMEKMDPEKTKAIREIVDSLVALSTDPELVELLDIDGDGKVTRLDSNLLFGPDGIEDLKYDLDGNGVVDMKDYIWHFQIAEFFLLRSEDKQLLLESIKPEIAAALITALGVPSDIAQTAARMLDKEIQEAAKDIYLTSTILTPEQGGWDAETVEAVFSAMEKMDPEKTKAIREIVDSLVALSTDPELVELLDIDGDGKVTRLDSNLLFGPDGIEDLKYDLDGNGVVDMNDWIWHFQIAEFFLLRSEDKQLLLESLKPEISAALVSALSETIDMGEIVEMLFSINGLKAADILSAMDAGETAEIITEILDKNDRSQLIRLSGFIRGWDVETAAEIFSEMDADHIALLFQEMEGKFSCIVDAEKAAAILSAMDADVSSKVIASDFISVEKAVEIFSAMDADSAASIFNTVFNEPSGISAVKAAAILEAMKSTPAALEAIDCTTAALIIASDNLRVDAAAAILNAMSDEKALDIIFSWYVPEGGEIGWAEGDSLTYISYDKIADIFEAMNPDKVASMMVTAIPTPELIVDAHLPFYADIRRIPEIFNIMDCGRAAKIFASDSMNVDVAAYIFSHMEFGDAADIIGASYRTRSGRYYFLPEDKAVEILSAMDKDLVVDILNVVEAAKPDRADALRDALGLKVEPESKQPVLNGKFDLNQDGVFDANDADMILQYIVGNVQVDEEQLAKLDVNNDGEVTSSDALLIKQVLAVLDLNGDGAFDTEDAEFIQEYIVGNIQLDEAQLAKCDIDGDGKITSTDALFLKHLIENEVTSELIDCLKPEIAEVLKAAFGLKNPGRRSGVLKKIR